MQGLRVWRASKFFVPFFTKSWNCWDVPPSILETDRHTNWCMLFLSLCLDVLPRVSWMLKVCRKDHYYLASSACNTMATEGKCDHEMCSSSWQTQKHSPSRTWSKQTHLPNGVELIGVPCSGFITHFNALPHFFPSFWQLNVILQFVGWHIILESYLR